VGNYLLLMIITKGMESEHVNILAISMSLGLESWQGPIHWWPHGFKSSDDHDQFSPPLPSLPVPLVVAPIIPSVSSVYEQSCLSQCWPSVPQMCVAMSCIITVDCNMNHCLVSVTTDSLFSENLICRLFCIKWVKPQPVIEHLCYSVRCTTGNFLAQIITL